MNNSDIGKIVHYAKDDGKGDLTIRPAIITGVYPATNTVSLLVIGTQSFDFIYYISFTQQYRHNCWSWPPTGPDHPVPEESEIARP